MPQRHISGVNKHLPWSGAAPFTGTLRKPLPYGSNPKSPNMKKFSQARLQDPSRSLLTEMSTDSLTAH